jgi:methionyl-tRNA formyltransferase
MARIDLFLDGNLGLWLLRRIDPTCVGMVVTTEEALANEAAPLFRRVTQTKTPDRLAPVGEIALSVHYHVILCVEQIARYKAIYNIHPSLLPWGRGYYPTFWALWERSPAGASFHRITEGVDKGPVVAQAELAYSDLETGGSLHARVQRAEKMLLMAILPRLILGISPEVSPQEGKGSYHSKADFERLRSAPSHFLMSPEQRQRLERVLRFET